MHTCAHMHTTHMQLHTFPHVHMHNLLPHAHTCISSPIHTHMHINTHMHLHTYQPELKQMFSKIVLRNSTCTRNVLCTILTFKGERGDPASSTSRGEPPLPSSHHRTERFPRDALCLHHSRESRGPATATVPQGLCMLWLPRTEAETPRRTGNSEPAPH